jgi:DNA-binding transcriptional ArsR family regulator
MPADQLSKTFAALADPTRRAILKHLTHGEATVNELAAPFPLSLQAVSKHVKVLENAGLITRTRNAQLRPSAIDGPTLEQAANWLNGYSDFFEGTLDRLEAHLENVQKKGSNNA